MTDLHDADPHIGPDFSVLNGREALQQLVDLHDVTQFAVNDDDDDDPVLLTLPPHRNVVDTWRQDYPYSERMSRREYEVTKRRLQIELLKLQKWSKQTGQRHLLVFEGRDAAGKGGTIKRFNEHLNPRGARVVALEKPSEREATEWYFQRYVQHLPAGGEMVFFDRSWYNRAGVERVMGFCSPAQYTQFVSQVPAFEKMLVDDGINLVKFWFSVTPPLEQRTRFAIRQIDRCGNGNSHRWTSRRWTSGMPTPRPRRRCSPPPTPTTRRGPW